MQNKTLAFPPRRRRVLDTTTTRPEEVFSLSSHRGGEGWGEESKSIECPSPRPSRHSFLAVRGRKFLVVGRCARRLLRHLSLVCSLRLWVCRAPLLCSLLFSGRLVVQARPDTNLTLKRLPHSNLLVYRNHKGETVPVQSVRDWNKRRDEILRGM